MKHWRQNVFFFSSWSWYYPLTVIFYIIKTKQYFTHNKNFGFVIQTDCIWESMLRKLFRDFYNRLVHSEINYNTLNHILNKTSRVIYIYIVYMWQMSSVFSKSQSSKVATLITNRLSNTPAREIRPSSPNTTGSCVIKVLIRRTSKLIGISSDKPINTSVAQGDATCV